MIEIITQKFAAKLWNERNLTLADELFTGDFVTEPIPYEQNAWHGTGPESMKLHIQHWCSVMPDLKMTIREIAASGTLVMYHWEFRGVMTGTFFGVPPVHREVSTTGFTISYFEGGRIKRNKTLWDKLHFMQQLNVLPSIREIIERKAD